MSFSGVGQIEPCEPLRPMTWQHRLVASVCVEISDQLGSLTLRLVIPWGTRLWSDNQRE